MDSNGNQKILQISGRVRMRTEIKIMSELHRISRRQAGGMVRALGMSEDNKKAEKLARPPGPETSSSCRAE